MTLSFSCSHLIKIVLLFFAMTSHGATILRCASLLPGDFTDKGFQLQHHVLWAKFMQQLKAEGKPPVKRALVPKEAVDHQERVGNEESHNAAFREPEGKDEPHNPMLQKPVDEIANAENVVKLEPDLPAADGLDEVQKKEILDDAADIDEGAGEAAPQPQDPAVERQQRLAVHGSPRQSDLQDNKAHIPHADDQAVDNKLQQVKFDAYLQDKADKMSKNDTMKNESNPYKIGLHKSRVLNQAAGSEDEGRETLGLLPWEKQGIFDHLQKVGLLARGQINDRF